MRSDPMRGTLLSTRHTATENTSKHETPNAMLKSDAEEKMKIGQVTEV